MKKKNHDILENLLYIKVRIRAAFFFLEDSHCEHDVK